MYFLSIKKRIIYIDFSTSFVSITFWAWWGNELDLFYAVYSYYQNSA